MATPDVNVSYHDLNSLNALRDSAKGNEEQAIRQAAKQFESVFMGMLLSSMRKANASFETDNPLNSQTTGFYRDMYDSQLSTELSKSGNLGLADMMVRQLAPQLNKDKIPQSLQTQAGYAIHNKTAIKPAHAAASFDIAPKLYQLPPEKTLTTPSTFSLKQRAASALPLAPQAAVSISTGMQPAELTQQLAPEVVLAAKIGRPVLKQSPIAADSSNKPSKTDGVTEVSTPAPDSPQGFVKRLWPAAQRAAAALGLEPAALIAQAALETGWGERMALTKSGQSSFNLFGVKASSSWQGDATLVDTVEFRQGVAKREKAAFRVYENLEQSMQDYVALIRDNPRYQQALAAGKDSVAYFQRLQAAGYATDPNYAQKLQAVYNSAHVQTVQQEIGT